MKKRLMFVTLCILCVLFSCVYAEETSNLGDVNKDGQITLEDAQMILKMALHVENVTEPASADIDQNGKVELADATMILKYALKILPEDETNTDSDFDIDDIVGAEEIFNVDSVNEYNGNISLLLKDADDMLFTLSITDDIVITKNEQEVSADAITAGIKVSLNYKLIQETYPGSLIGCTYIKIHEPLLE